MKACHSAVLRDAEGKEGTATPSACHEHTLHVKRKLEVEGDKGLSRP